MVGPVVSGAFIKHNVGRVNDGWRANYYLGAGFYFISFLALLVFYHPAARPTPDGLSLWARFVRIDWLGILLFTSDAIMSGVYKLPFNGLTIRKVQSSGESGWQ